MAPTRGRRGAAAKKPAPVKKITRQKRGQKTEVEPNTEVISISEEPTSQSEEDSSKITTADKSVSMVESSSEEETEKPKKGRRGAKTVAKESPEISEKAAVEEPTRSSRRGAKSVQTEIVEESVAEVASPALKPTRGRRGAPKVEEKRETVETKPSGRGRRGAKTIEEKSEVVEAKEAEVEPAASVSKPAARGRRGAKAVEEEKTVEDIEQAPAVVEEEVPRLLKRRKL